MMCTSAPTLKAAIVPKVVYDKTEPRVSFAAEDVQAALEVDPVSSSEASSWQVSLTTASPAEGLHPESYSIICDAHSRTVRVKGGGATGTMYGGLRVAELLRHDAAARAEAAATAEPFGGGSGAPLSRIPNTAVAAPLLELRGLKLNAPLDARTPSYGDMGDSAQHNIETMLWRTESHPNGYEQNAGYRPWMVVDVRDDAACHVGLLESVSVQNGERYIAWSTDTPKVEEIAGLVSSLLP